MTPAPVATHDILDSGGQTAGEIDVYDDPECAVVRVPSSDPMTFVSVGAALEKIQALGCTVPELEA